MEMVIAFVVFVVVGVIVMCIAEREWEFITLVALLVLYIVVGTCGTFRGKRMMREEAVKNGAAEWVTTTDPNTGKCYSVFKWIDSRVKEVKEVKEVEKTDESN